ncbi:membrane assembly protein AsmA [Luteibacter flocculans]|uniref:Membrane assembly protein AsmA n=1 Tax=Luteibacter flocculans TaxID=2780091 RepID=A0ABY4T0N6_9GAMM|nr:membrane assembly protein AsmA [Luteibacter flocculans]URL57642.1 membrane assembly protein AsmA [Luteibacter flocculans]
MTRRLRIGLYIVGGILAMLILAMFIAMYVVLQPARFTALLQSRARDVGLELTLANPASPTVWPKPALELEGITLRSRGVDTPMLVAARGKLVLPWHTLMGGEARISRLEVEGARIDVDAVSTYLDTLPSRPSTAGAMLPTADAGFRVTRGTLTRGNALLLANVDIDAGRLANGRPFTLALSASTPDGIPYALELATTPSLAQGVLTLSDLTVGLSSTSRFDATMRGTATWRGAADVGGTLSGKITRTAAPPYDIVLAVTPANQRDPLYVALKLDGDNDHTDIRIPPIALADWWAGLRTGAPITPPPLLGTLEAKAVDVGAVHATGLRIKASPTEPVNASTSALPATAHSAP